MAGAEIQGTVGTGRAASRTLAFGVWGAGSLPVARPHARFFAALEEFTVSFPRNVIPACFPTLSRLRPDPSALKFRQNVQ